MAVAGEEAMEQDECPKEEGSSVEGGSESAAGLVCAAHAMGSVMAARATGSVMGSAKAPAMDFAEEMNLSGEAKQSPADLPREGLALQQIAEWRERYEQVRCMHP